MKLPFFKKRNIVSTFSETNSNNIQAEILNKFERGVIMPTGLVMISYFFICENGRTGDKFAEKLADDGDEVTYYALKNGTFQISGKTKKMEPNEQLIKDKLLAMVEKGIKFNCFLSDWSINE